MDGEPEWLTRLHALPLSNEERGEAIALIKTTPAMQQMMASQTTTPEAHTTFVRSLLLKAAAAAQPPAASPGLASVPPVLDPSCASPEVLAGLQRLADALAAAKVDEEYLMLPDDLPVELPAPLRTSIYVRAAYRRVIPRLCIAEGGSRTTFPEASRTTTLDGAGSAVVEDAAKGVPLARSTRTFLGHVLTGPPGSGTSSIAPLVVAHLAQHKQPVLYRYFNPRSLEQYVMLDFTCSPPCVDIEYADRPKRLAAYMRSSETWLLWDGPPSSGQFNGDGPMLVMSPPNDENYRAFVKGEGASVMYMSAFALNEFLKVAPLYGVSPSTAVDRYRIFGGVIRPALVKLEETEAVLRANVSDAAARELLDLNLISTRSRTSHTLVHLVSDHEFNPKYLALASPVVREIVYEKAYRHNLQEMELLVQGGTGRRGVAGFAGHMFEQYGHCVLPEGAMYVHMRQLRPSLQQVEVGSKRARGSEGDVAQGTGMGGGVEGDGGPEDDGQESHNLPTSGALEAASYTLRASMVGQALQQLGLDVGSTHLPRVQRVWDSPGKDISGLQQVYLQPPTANNASWDAYYAHGDQRYVLQYTVSRPRGVKHAPILQLLKRLQLRADQVKLVFVVPSQLETLYDTFSWQPWQGVGGSLLVPSSWPQMQQWVLELPLLPQ